MATGHSPMLYAAIMALGMAMPGTASEPPSVTGSWLAEDIEGGGVIDYARTTLEIGDGSVSGSGGCNRFTGTAELAGERMTVGPLAATEMACASALMDQEAKFFAALAKVTGFEIDPAQRKLMLHDADGGTLIVLSRVD